MLLLAFLLLPMGKIRRAQEEIALAKTLYAMAGNESYDALLALGGMAVNRLQSEDFPDALSDVLSSGDFYRGSGLNEAALMAAREVLTGDSGLPENYLFFGRGSDEMPKKGFAVGDFYFY